MPEQEEFPCDIGRGRGGGMEKGEGRSVRRKGKGKVGKEKEM